jgi:hypothetical protein
LGHPGFQSFSKTRINRAIEDTVAARPRIRLDPAVLKKIGAALSHMRDSGMGSDTLIVTVVTDVLKPAHSSRVFLHYEPSPELIGAYVATTKAIVEHLAKPVPLQSHKLQFVRPVPRHF